MNPKFLISLCICYPFFVLNPIHIVNDTRNKITFYLNSTNSNWQNSRVLSINQGEKQDVQDQNDVFAEVFTDGRPTPVIQRLINNHYYSIQYRLGQVYFIDQGD